jgi:hypothetical protein
MEAPRSEAAIFWVLLCKISVPPDKSGIRTEGRKDHHVITQIRSGACL